MKAHCMGDLRQCNSFSDCPRKLVVDTFRSQVRRLSRFPVQSCFWINSDCHDNPCDPHLSLCQRNEARCLLWTLDSDCRTALRCPGFEDENVVLPSPTDRPLVVVTPHGLKIRRTSYVRPEVLAFYVSPVNIRFYCQELYHSVLQPCSNNPALIANILCTFHPPHLRL